MTNRPTASRRRTSLAFWATTRPRPTSSSARFSSTPGEYDLAVKALERGLVYDEDNSTISLTLADTLLKLNKGEQALALVERHIERQTPLVETYELLAKVLKALNREKEITPRLEAAARRDSKNVPLQYLLADRYRETGEIDKAEALYKELLTSQPTPQIYRALADFAFETEESRRPAQSDQRSVESARKPGGCQAAAPGRRRR